MDSERKQEIERLFDEALDVPPQERERFLRRACGDDGALLREVTDLLGAHERAFGILDVPTSAVQAALLEDVPGTALDPPPGLRLERIGPYRLVRRLGGGGMGSVHLAERDDAFRQRVAVKLLRRGLDTDDVVARFRAERQILASLDHPNIARLLDGGVTPKGRPYLVMEYVDGDPIDVYCDRLQLSVQGRLRLFSVVARAVQHAHRNLVVHRDLKPSNVLVDGRGTVKLLDFGIAKLLDPSAGTASIPVTRTDYRYMTPEYASPEQVRGEPVTTSADVYALGILLYELLTGHRPHPIRGRTLSDMIRAVCETEPARPSTVVGQSAEVGSEEEPRTLGPEDVARNRGVRPERLRRLLRGDLDRIVAMALRKEPARRYPSAEQLAEDVDRYLAGLPVRARGDSVGYRARKFIARHRWGVAVTMALVAVLTAYAVTLA